MKTKVGKWGNSLAVRIPKSVALAAGLEIGDVLEVKVRRQYRQRIRGQRTLVLKELVSGITADNIHDDINWGSAVGNEWW